MSRSLFKRAVQIFAAFLLLTPALSSRQVQQIPPSQTPTAVRVASRLVQVNVIVESHGQPVSSLKQEDFALYDQGQQQKIAFFSEQTVAPPSASISATTPAPALAADVFTNRVAQQSGVPSSVTVILLDLLNTHASDAAYARNQVFKLIESLKPNDRVALYVLRDDIHILHEFTTDSAELIRALQRYKAAESHNVGASEYTAADTDFDDLNAFLDLGSQRTSDFFTINRVELTAWGLQAIANHLAAFPGRKNLVWVSSSFPSELGLDGNYDITNENRTFSDETEAAARALNNANVAIYPVDARALVSGGGGPTPYPRQSTILNSGRNVRYATAAPPVATTETMNNIAERTGGKAYFNTNDLSGAIRRAIDDARDSYVLSYYPTNEDWNGKFREIKVSLLHHSAEIRYRKGYFAFPLAAPTADQQKKILADISTSPLEDTDFGLTLQADPATPATASQASASAVPALRKLSTRLKVDISQMNFSPDGGRYLDKLDVVWVQVGSDGKPISSITQTVDLNLTPETFAKVRATGLGVTNTVSLRPECTTLRVVARDQGSGIVGSINVPLKRIFPPAQAASPAPQGHQ